MDTEVVVTEQNYKGLWIITPFEENDYWFLKTGRKHDTYISNVINILYRFLYFSLIFF